jgi:hypothetical protein
MLVQMHDDASKQLGETGQGLGDVGLVAGPLSSSSKGSKAVTEKE